MEPQASQLIALRKWRLSAGISDVTAWRWAKRGWISPVNICGRLYLRLSDLQEFERRAAAGEFASAPQGAAAVASMKPSEDWPPKPENIA